MNSFAPGLTTGTGGTSAAGTGDDLTGARGLLPPGDIAIVGMACIFPGAPDLQSYWENIVSKVDAVTDPPEDWGADFFYDPDSRANDRIYCKRGGYLGELARFNPLDYGIMPLSVDGGEPDHYLALRLAYEALADAGADSQAIVGERMEVIIGRGTYVNRGWATLVQHGVIVDQTLRILKELHPEHTPEELQAIKRELKASLPPFNAETAPGLIPNIITGRIANRLDLMGTNYIVDAACASSLIAVETGMRDLLTQKCDLVLAGGVQASTPAPLHMIFCQLNALSRRCEIRPFDKDADGTMLGEGAGVVVLKRQEDAERDGDRIYALIKGVGVASDGRGLGLLTPRVEGEALALQRAYEMAGISPRTVELIEAHGTGTPVGDLAEIQALRRIFDPHDGVHPFGGPQDRSWCALGSVKSMISHLIPAAGIAGLIKAALALYHKVLPPTLHCDEPNPQFELGKTPFYINTETRPWVHGALDTPRRAGVNAFGFGGINAHVILEEYADRHCPNADCQRTVPVRINRTEDISFHRNWDSEVLILQGESRLALIERGQQIQRYLAGAPEVALRDLAYTLGQRLSANSQLEEVSYRLAIVASSLQDFDSKLARALGRLADPECTRIKDRSGIYFFEEPLGRQGKLAFLFPGEGSQYVNMLSDLSMHFPEVRACFDLVDRAFANSGRRNHLPSRLIFPPPNSGAEEDRLWQMEGAVAAVTTANRALLTLLSRLEIRPQVLLGHSTGEFTALQAAGIMDLADESLYEQCVADLDGIYQRAATEDGVPRAVMVAVGADSTTVSQIIGQSNDGIHIAMDNCLHQTVIAGQEAAVERTIEHMRRQGLIYEVLPFDRPYHTPLFEAYAESLRRFFNRWLVSSPHVPLYSCTTMAPYPADLAQIRELAFQHWVSPVEFRRTIEAMYADGVRIFVEVGPKGNLTAFVDDILRTRPHLAVASNVPSRSGITQLNHAVALLAAQGVHLQLHHLYARRVPQKLSLRQASGQALEAAVDRAGRQEATPGSMKLTLGLPILQLGKKERVSEVVKERMDEGTDGRMGESAGQRASKSGQEPRVAIRDSQLVPVQRTGIVQQTGSVQRRGIDHSSNSRSLVMQEYLRTMEHFLGAQQAVMQAFLVGNDAVVTPPASTIGPASATTSLPTGVLQGLQPEQADAARLEAPFIPAQQPVAPDQVQASQEEVVALPATTESEPSPTEIAEIIPESIGDILLRLVSEKTGYPLEMLDLTLNLEADLGIDSIKRVEILGALQQQTGAFETEDLEQIAGLKTLQEMITFLRAWSEHANSQPVLRTDVHEQRSPQSLTPVPDRAQALSRLPLVGTVTSMIPGQELVARREISLEEDLFLLDHTLGRQVSVTDQGLRGLPVMPLTMSMEIMAEAAALLLPDRLPIGMKDIRAYRWIVLEEQPPDSTCPLTLQIIARCKVSPPSEEVEVQIREIDGATTSRSAVRGPIIEGKVIFGDTYPEPPPAGEFSLRSEQPCKFGTPGRFYPKAMFHGPSFQGVVSVDRWGENGVEATVRGLPDTELFQSVPNPSFVTDPVLLDALGQVVGFWIANFPEAGFVAFPFGLKALHIYEPNLRPWERATCQARIVMAGDERVQSDIDLLGQDGRLRMRLVGWEDTGFNMPRDFFRFILTPGDVVMSSPWPMPLAEFPVSDDFQCCRLDGFPRDFFEAHGEIWKHALAHLVLSPRERETWRNLGGSQKRRTEWLLGRVVAKDAVRLFLRRTGTVRNRYGMELCPADIEIVADEHGRPMVQGLWTEELERVPILSLSHSDGVAVAIAGDASSGIGGGQALSVGIDIERVGRVSREAIEGLAFTPQERQLLALMGDTAGDEWALRLWCAKEAVAKALGRGMVGGPQTLVAQELDAHTGRVRIALVGEMTRTGSVRPPIVGGAVTAYTAREGDLIVATSLCERR